MTAVYFTVGNLPQVLRSLQKFIFLALLVKHGLVKQWAYDTYFSSRALETIRITDKYGKVYRGAVATVTCMHMLWLGSDSHLAVVEYVVSVWLVKMKSELNSLRKNLLYGHSPFMTIMPER